MFCEATEGLNAWKSVTINSLKPIDGATQSDNKPRVLFCGLAACHAFQKLTRPPGCRRTMLTEKSGVIGRSVRKPRQTSDISDPLLFCFHQSFPPPSDSIFRPTDSCAATLSRPASGDSRCNSRIWRHLCAPRPSRSRRSANAVVHAAYVVC